MLQRGSAAQHLRRQGLLHSAVVEAATADAERPSYTRLAFWTLFVALIAASNYYGRFAGGNGRHSTSHVSVYSYSTFASSLILYLLWLGIVLLIAIDRFDLLALRAPQSWRHAVGLAVLAVAVIVAAEVVAALLPLPETPGKEQGIAPTHWQPAHAGAFAANVVLFAIVAPFVEELTFRGVGQSLLRFLGNVPSILIVGVAFGAAHGLVEGLIVLVPFGMALAWLRSRTDSVLPGMVVHGLFNGVTLALAVLIS